MGRVAILLLLLTSSARGDDFVWLEGNWISDGAATLEANPELKDLEDATRARLKRLFGLTAWRFDSNGTFEEAGDDSPPSSYAVHQLDDQRAELQIYERGEGSVFEIWKTKSGFCAKRDALQSAPLNFAFVQCFKRNGA